MRWFLTILLILVAPLAAMGQTSFYTDRALQQVNIVASPTPLTAAIPYGSVRVCSLPLTQQQPCLPLATITDINGNPVSNSIGPLFGQLTTDVTGRFTFGCAVNNNYQVQVTQSASNTPAVNYPITCPGTGNNPTFTNLTVSGVATFSGTSKYAAAALFGAGPIFDVTAPPFNADPTGVADSTAAIQSAITTAAGRWVYVPAGTYKTSADLTYITCGDLPGIHIYGDGGLKSVLAPTHSNGWAIRLEGACIAQPQTFQRFGMITGIGIVPTAGSNTGGIKSTGNWYLWITNNNINGTTGDGIQFPVRTDLGSNADLYGNNYWHIVGNNLQHSGGFGFDQQDGPEGLGEFKGNNVISNALGGAILTGEGNQVSGNTFSYNGNSNNTLTTCANAQAAGLLLDAGGGPGSVDSTAIEDNEFDANCYANIWIRRSLGLRIGPNRQLNHTGIVANDGVNRPTTMIRADGVLTVESFQLTNQRFRGDFGLAGANCGGAPPCDQNVTLVQLQQAGVGNISGGTIQDMFVATGNISANTTTFAVASGAIVTVTQSGGVVQNTAVVKDGGAGYANTPACSIIDQTGGGTLATCTAATTRGVVDAVLTASGSGYTTGATIAFSGGGCAVQATGSVIVNGNNAVSFIKLLTPGSGCTSVPVCTISPVGAGSGATCSAGIAFVISSVTVTAGGGGYITPKVVINPNAADQGLAAFGVAPTNVDIFDRVLNQAYFNVPLVNLPMTSLGLQKWSTDTGFSRISAGALGVGNGTQGDISGTIRATDILAGSGVGAIQLFNGQVQSGGGAVMGLTNKTGSGAGNYTNTNTTYAAVDTTNLCATISVPTGWKLKIDADGVLESVTAAVAQNVALADAGTTCTGGGVTALNGTERNITPPVAGVFDEQFHTQFVFTGDGAAHSILLVAKTSNAADAWGIQNTSVTIAPSLIYTLMPSN